MHFFSLELEFLFTVHGLFIELYWGGGWGHKRSPKLWTLTQSLQTLTCIVTLSIVDSFSFVLAFSHNVGRIAQKKVSREGGHLLCRLSTRSAKLHSTVGSFGRCCLFFFLFWMVEEGLAFVVHRRWSSRRRRLRSMDANIQKRRSLRWNHQSETLPYWSIQLKTPSLALKSTGRDCGWAVKIDIGGVWVPLAFEFNTQMSHHMKHSTHGTLTDCRQSGVQQVVNWGVSVSADYNKISLQPSKLKVLLDFQELSTDSLYFKYFPQGSLEYFPIPRWLWKIFQWKFLLR